MRPFINIYAESLPQAYREMCIRLEEEGQWSLKESYAFNTKFDKIKECESRVAIKNLFQEPMISGALSMTTIKNFIDYVTDILFGTKDYLVSRGTYDYTYSDRLFRRPLGTGGQLGYVIKKLGESKGHTNRAQATTWIPEVDSMKSAPPCLQRIWFKVEDNVLHVESDWRSRDFYGAWYENIIGMAAISLLVRECLKDYFSMDLSNDVFYVDRCNSLHVYEKRYDEFKKDVEVFKKREPKNWNSKDPYLIKMWGGRELFSPVQELKARDFDPIFK
jgi:thymidylate synthase